MRVQDIHEGQGRDKSVEVLYCSNHHDCDRSHSAVEPGPRLGPNGYHLEVSILNLMLSLVAREFSNIYIGPCSIVIKDLGHP